MGVVDFSAGFSAALRATQAGARFPRRLALVAVTVLLVAGAPGPSHAGTQTLTRSVQNLLLFPFDIVLSPAVATKITFDNWRDSDDTTAVKWGYAPFAPIWSISISVGASAIRGVAGALELLPGLVLLPFDSEMDPIYDLPENQPAWVDQEAGPFKIRFGVNYISSEG